MSNRASLFDLECRRPREDPFTSIDQCRAYDLDIRRSMVIPMQHMMKLMAPWCRPGWRLLEIGAGSGLLSLRLAALFPQAEFFALENNDHFLGVLQDNLIFAHLLNYPGRIQFEWSRYSRLPVEDAAVDAVFSFCSMSRWKFVADVLRECARVCRRDGAVILYDLARDADDGMISFILQYTGANHQEFMSALQSSFTVAEMRGLLTELGLGHWQVVREGINLIISSQPIDTHYTVGEPEVYERVAVTA